MVSIRPMFPVIDVSDIHDPTTHVHIAQGLTSACSKWGFILLKGHSIPKHSIDNMFNLSRYFFSLAEQEKECYPITTLETGYMGSFRDSGKDDKMSMWFGGAAGTLASQKSSLPPFWHQHIDEVEHFKSECHHLVMNLLECFAVAMELPHRDFFGKAHTEDSEHGNSLRSILYPARLSRPETTGSRMRAHTDSGSVTLLFQQAVGLEVLSPSGDWVTAPCLEDHILVNLGDALSFWSGRFLKATLHRVTFDTLPYNKARQSMAYFAKARPETVLQPLINSDTDAVEKYMSNQVELVPGMTVGELTKQIMKRIYG